MDWQNLNRVRQLIYFEIFFYFLLLVLIVLGSFYEGFYYWFSIIVAILFFIPNFVILCYALNAYTKLRQQVTPMRRHRHLADEVPGGAAYAWA